MARLAIIRHGRTEWNRDGKIQGHRDIPLEPAAIAELATYRLPDEWQHAALLSSPLNRAVHTAELISDRTPLIEPALIEMDYGDCCLLYTSPSPRDGLLSRMPSSA